MATLPKPRIFSREYTLVEVGTGIKSPKFRTCIRALRLTDRKQCREYMYKGESVSAIGLIAIDVCRVDETPYSTVIIKEIQPYFPVSIHEVIAKNEAGFSFREIADWLENML